MKIIKISVLIMIIAVRVFGLSIAQGSSILENRMKHFSLNPQMDYTVNTFTGPVVLTAYTDSNYGTNPNQKRDGGIDLESADPEGDKSSCNMVGLFYHYMNPAEFSDSAVFSDSVDVIIQDSLIDMSSAIHQCRVIALQESDRVLFRAETQYSDIAMRLFRKNPDGSYSLLSVSAGNTICDNSPADGINMYKLEIISGNEIVYNEYLKVAVRSSNDAHSGVYSLTEINRLMSKEEAYLMDLTGRLHRKISSQGIYIYNKEKIIVVVD